MILPLFLTYQGTIIGNGFIAQIEARMKILAEKTDGGTTFCGVVPADVTARGQDLDEAHAQLRSELRQRFVDIATEQTSFQDFERQMTTFCMSVDASKQTAWDGAVTAMRAKRDVSLLGIPMVKAETETFIRVTQKTPADLTPELNEPQRVEPMSGAAHMKLAA